MIFKVKFFVTKIQDCIGDIFLFRSSVGRSMVYYFLGLFLSFIILFLLRSSIYGFVFFTLTISCIFLKISYKIPVSLSLVFLILCAFSSILGDKYLAEIFAIYTYLFLWCGFLIQTKLFLNKKWFQKGDDRLPLSLFQKLSIKSLVLVVLIIFGLLFLKDIILEQSYLEIGDLNFPIVQKNILQDRFLWLDRGGWVGRSNAQLFIFDLVHFPLFFLNFNKISFFLVEMVFIDIFFLYFLAQKIFKNFINKEIYLNLSAFLTAFFFLFNPYALNRIFHFYHWLAYSFLPLIFLVFLKFLETKKVYLLFVLAFLLSFISFSPHYLVYSLIMLGLFSLIELIRYLWQDRRNFISLVLKNTAYFFIFFFAFLLFSSHWLIPYLKTSLLESEPQAPSYVFSKQYIEIPQKRFQSIKETLSLNGERPKSRVLNFFFLIFVLSLPFVLTLPLWPGLRNRYTVFFSVLGILAAVFSTMPIWNYLLYQKFLFNLPYLKTFNWLFREAYRINGLLALSYSFLLGFLFLRLLKIKFNQIKLFYIILASLIIFWAGIAWRIM